MKILAVRNDRFGEFLLNIPALRALKNSFPRVTLSLVVDSYVAELARCIDGVDEVLVWDNIKHSFKDVQAFSKQLKKKEIDVCVIFNPSKEFNLISFLAGIPVRVGYSRKWSFLLTKKIKDTKHLGQKHEVDYNLGLVSIINAKTKDKSLSLRINDDMINRLANDCGVNFSAKLVAVHPWTSDPVKQWPQDKFRSLIEQLARDANVVVVGGAQEANRSAALTQGLASNIVNLSGKTSLVELAALLKRCKCLISADSGPVHLAAAVGTPVVAIFRNDLPGKTAKRWGPWGNNHIVIEGASLPGISVEEVLNKSREIIYR